VKVVGATAILVALLASALSVMPLSSAYALTTGEQPCLELVCPTGTAAASGPGYVLTLQGRASLAALERSSPTVDGQAIFVRLELACGTGPLQDICTGLPTPCPGRDEQRFIVMEGPSPANEALAPVATVCLGPADVVQLGKLEADVAAGVRRLLRLPQAIVHSAPPGATLVNLPTVVWATERQPAPVTAVLDGASVTISVTPSVSWAFGDGAALDAVGPGLPYLDSAGGASPNLVGYLTHTYVEPGVVRIRALVTWSPTYTITGVAGTFTTDPITLVGSELLQVRASQGVLTGNS
jgi:hypothetical protein